MNENKIKAELLAPAGSIESLKAAVINRADAVYLGLNEFNARANAKNFSLETLKEAINYAHMFSVKVYLAINILLNDNEIKKAVETAKAAWDCGISAVIVQDLGFIRAIKNKYPQIVLHASTQMGIHNLLGAQVAKSLGIERVILSRETPLDEIKNIAKNCAIELEYFVHGALCCSFSGNCYFSGMVAKRSGNKGKCLQLCRKPYLMGEKGFWLSTRDTMLINDLKTLCDAGISSFKIEGRMRRPEYVGEVTRIYKKAMEGGLVTSDDINQLKLMFNRGNFSRAHLDGVDFNIIYPKLPSHMGIKLGNVKSAFKSKAVLNCAVNKGSGLKFLRGGGEVGHALVLHDGYETGFVGNVRAGDEVFLTDCPKNNEQINSLERKVKLNLDVHFSLKDNSCQINAKWEQSFKQFIYPIELEPAKNKPLGLTDIKECLTSLGGTHFECTVFNATWNEEFFAPKSVLKAMRRQFVDDFRAHLLASFSRPNANVELTDIFSKLQPFKTKDCCTIIMCEPNNANEYEQYADYIAIKPWDYSELLSNIKLGKFKPKPNYLLDLPVICLGQDAKILQELIELNAFENYIANNLYALKLIKSGKILLGYKMNILNHQIDFPKVMSIESPPAYNKNDFVYAFGNVDLMQTVHCYYNIKLGCGKCVTPKPLTITDDKGEIYTIKKQKIHNCYNLITSNKPLNAVLSAKKRFIDLSNCALIGSIKDNLII